MTMTLRCAWRRADEGADVWRPSCDAPDRLRRFEFTEGGPRANHFAYCPYCGRPLMEMRVRAGDEA